MNKIQMVDLKGQYLKIKDEVDAGIRDVIDNTAFINGFEFIDAAQKGGFSCLACTKQEHSFV